jgi:hypothetical protein
MKLIPIFAALALTGCAGMKTTGQTTVAVKVPVAVSCQIPDVKKPVFAVSTLPVGADIFVQTKAMVAERLQRIAYENSLESIINASKEQPK